MKKYTLFVCLFVLLFSCGGKKMDSTKLLILTSKINAGQMPKDLIELILPFNEGKDIIFSPIIKNINNDYSFDVTKSANTSGLSLRMVQLQKKVKPLYESVKLPDSLKMLNENNFSKEEYLKKMNIDKDSVFVVVYGNNNKNYEFLKEYPKIIVENANDVESFRKKISIALQKSPKINVCVLYNAEFKIKSNKSEGDILANAEKLKQEIEARNDSIKQMTTEKEKIQKTKEGLIAVREKTTNSTDRERVDAQILELTQVLNVKDGKIRELQTKVQELEKKVKELEQENIELKGKNQVLTQNLIDAKTGQATAIAESAEEKRKREEAEKQAIINQINGFVEQGKQQTINVRLERGKLIFYQLNDKGEWKPESINRLKNIRPLRQKYREAVCNTYKKAFELAKSNNLLGELSNLNAIFKEKQDIALKLASKAEEPFEDNVTQSTFETWFNKVCP